MTETETAIKICKCGTAFRPQYRNGLLISRSCPDCRYNAALVLRVAQLNVSKIRDVESANLPVKEVVREKRTTEPGKKKVGKGSRTVDYSKKKLSALLEIAKTHFNKFIRNRDALPNGYFHCPTCGNTKKIIGDNYQACHVFPAGLYPALRFNEINVWGGCKSDNYFKHGASYEYNDWLRHKIGEAEYKKLEDLKDYWKRNTFKWDRFTVIHIIETYKAKNKEYLLSGELF